MKNKKWLRPVAFILMLTIAVLGVLQCYGLPRNDYYTNHSTAFDSEGENLVDGILLGTSVIAHSWVAPVAWQNYGIAAYHLSMSVQPFGVMDEYINYANKKQDIKYVIIDIHGLRKDAVYNSLLPANFRSTYLRVPDLVSQYRILKDLFDYTEDVYEFYGVPEVEANIIDPKDMSYYFPFLNFHNRWVDGLNKYDFVTVQNQYLGADTRNGIFYSLDCSPFVSCWEFGEVKDIDEFQKAQLQEIFDYAEKNDIKLLFINTPSFRSTEVQQEMRDIIVYCKNQGYNTIDFSSLEMIEELDIDLKKDFVDKGHLNGFGGAKITKYLCEYLIANGYHTPDHRGDERYAHWDEDTKAYMEHFEKGKAYIEKKSN